MVTIRRAITEEDLHAVYRLRYELYVDDQKLFLEEADHERRWLYDDYDPHSRIFLAEVDGELVGTSRITLGIEAEFSQESREAYDFERFGGIVDERDLTVVTRLVVRHEHRGGSLGTRLLEACYAEVARENGELILGNCEPHLISHYLKLGFRPFGQLVNHPTNATLVRIAVVTGDYDYLERVDSPMLPALQLRTRPSEALPGILGALARDPAILTEKQTDPDHYWGEVYRHVGSQSSGFRGALAALETQEAEALFSRSQILTYQNGDALFFVGHTSKTIYVLLDGSLEIRNQRGHIIRQSEPGSLVGVSAFFGDGIRRSEAIVRSADARVLALNLRVLQGILAGHLAVAAKFLHAVTRTLCQQMDGPGSKTLSTTPAIRPRSNGSSSHPRFGAQRPQLGRERREPSRVAA